MKINKNVIKLIIYAHENGIELTELDVNDVSGCPTHVEYTVKKRGRKSKIEPKTGASIGDKAILEMRQFISVKKAFGKLSETQITAIDSTKGVRVNELTIGQREQIENIYKDLKK